MENPEDKVAGARTSLLIELRAKLPLIRKDVDGSTDADADSNNAYGTFESEPESAPVVNPVSKPDPRNHASIPAKSLPSPRASSIERSSVTGSTKHHAELEMREPVYGSVDDKDEVVCGSATDKDELVYGEVSETENWPSMSRDESENFLAKKKEGDFIVRRSQSDKNSLTVSARCSGEKHKVAHFKIMQDAEKYFFQNNNQNTFDTPEELLDYHISRRTRLRYQGEFVCLRKQCNAKAQTLIQPLKRDTEDGPADGLEGDGVYGDLEIPEESWFFPGSDRENAETILLSDGRVGSYLARCSKTGDFALSVRYEGQHNVAHFKINKEVNKFFLNRRYQFPSLTELIGFLKRNDSMLKYFGETVCLKYPMVKNQTLE